METVRAFILSSIDEVYDFVSSKMRWPGVLWVGVCLLVSLLFAWGRFTLAGPSSGRLADHLTVSGSYQAFAHLWVAALFALAIPPRFLPDRRRVFLALAIGLTLVETLAFLFHRQQ